MKFVFTLIIKTLYRNKAYERYIVFVYESSEHCFNFSPSGNQRILLVFQRLRSIKMNHVRNSLKLIFRIKNLTFIYSFRNSVRFWRISKVNELYAYNFYNIFSKESTTFFFNSSVLLYIIRVYNRYVVCRE